jgi:hypothetical protein
MERLGKERITPGLLEEKERDYMDREGNGKGGWLT